MARRRIAGAVSVPLILASLITSGCGIATRPVAPGELEARAFAAVVAEPATLTVNVHTPDEGSIDGTDLYLPYDQVTVDRSHLPSDRATPIAVYCRSGRMSDVAAEALRRLGYQDVVELQGGMDAWAQRGLPLRAP